MILSAKSHWSVRRYMFVKHPLSSLFREWKSDSFYGTWIRWIFTTTTPASCLRISVENPRKRLICSSCDKEGQYLQSPKVAYILIAVAQTWSVFGYSKCDSSYIGTAFKVNQTIKTLTRLIEPTALNFAMEELKAWLFPKENVSITASHSSVGSKDYCER